MFFTLHARNTPARRALRIATVAWSLGVCLGVGSMPALATTADSSSAVQAATTVPWHRDIAQARAASLVSKRPVLVIFTAAWSEASRAVQRTTLAAPEAAALITACYEPVNVDVDADPALTRSLGVSNIPAACIVDADGKLITRFDCPEEPAAFVAAAARAMQEATQARPAETAIATMPREQSDFTKNSAAVVPAAAAAPAPAGFAQPPIAPAPAAVATTEPDAAVAAEPSLPAAPPAWRAEPATPAAHATAVPPANDAQRRLLEPSPSTGTAPWLNSTAQQTAASPAIPQAAAPPATASSVATAEPQPEKKSATDSFFAALKKPFTMFTKPKDPTDPKVAAAGGATSSKTGDAVAATPPDPHGSMPLGLEGYCAVSLAEKGQWVEGRAQWGARHRGRTYLFAGAEQQQAFLANPDRYAPALSGDDPVLACDTGKQIAGQRRYGVTYQARTYLFSSPETRTAFAANPQRYTTRVKLAEQTLPTGTILK
jgi:YHS domain-containing protein/thioredoxin-like negative regulator of GroEL